MKRTTLTACLLALTGLTQVPAFAMMHATPGSAESAAPAQEGRHTQSERQGERAAPPRKAGESTYSVPVRPPQNRAP